MTEKDLIREARAALGDLADSAPKPPKLDAMTGHFVLLETASTRRRRWMSVAAFAGAAAATILVVGVVALVGSGGADEPAAVETTTVTGPTRPLSVESLHGIWILDSYTFGGEDVDVAAAAAAGELRSTAPWVDFREIGVSGYAGCNRFGNNEPSHVDGNTLTFGGGMMSTMMGCMESTPEPAMKAAFHGGPDGVTIDIAEHTLTLTNDSVVLRFVRGDRRPFPPPRPWDSGNDWIDCSPGTVIPVNVEDPGRPIADVLLDVPGVVSTEGSDPFWRGFDAGEDVVVHGAIGDITPPIYHLHVCDETAGIRSDADLADLTYIWVSDLGIGHSSDYVWGARLAEMCALPDGSDLAPLAERYLAEDTKSSLRAGGALPTVEEAAQALDLVHRGACAPGRNIGEAAFVSIVMPDPSDRVSRDAPQCSTAGMMSELQDYEPSYSGLSDRAAVTRTALIEAALECDFQSLTAIAVESGPGDPRYEDTFWEAVRSVDELVDYDQHYGHLRLLVLALTSVPAGVSHREAGDPETNPGGTRYEWPPILGDSDDAFDILDRWDAETIERVAALNNKTADELVEFVNANGYSLFRVGIHENGRWLYALDGD